jgi:hypothetical protein
MELDELKERRHLITAPRGRSGKPPDASQSGLDSLIEKLKAEDARQLASLKRARPFWWIAAALWIVVFLMIVLRGGEASLQENMALPLRGLLALLFSGLAAALYIQTKRLSALDYSEPVALFLRRAAKRYRFMTTPILVLSILICAVLALAASFYITYVFERYFGIHDRSVGTMSTFAFTGLVFLFGYLVTKRGWKKTRGPMLEQIVKMQNDLRSDLE